MAEKVGILGLGLIGSLAAEILMPEGYECAAVRRPSTESFPDTGGKLFDTARELAEWADVLISALPRLRSTIPRRRSSIAPSAAPSRSFVRARGSS